MFTINDDKNRINSLQEALERFDLSFDVEKKSLAVAGGKKVSEEIGTAVVRSDKGETLGIVSAKYPAISPAEKFASLDPFIKDQTLKISNGGNFGNGGVFLEATIGEPLNINPKIGDIVEKKVLFKTSYTGLYANDIVAGAFRLICTNGLVIPAENTKNFSKKFKNSKNSGILFPALAEPLSEILNQFKKVDEMLLKANEIKISEKEAKNFVKRVLKVDSKKENEISTRTHNQISDIMQSIFENIGQTEISDLTAYKVLNGITAWTNHDQAGSKDNPFDYLLIGTGEKVNSAAWREMEKLVTV